jgi:uncharacterized protein (DUF302 family)
MNPEQSSGLGINLRLQKPYLLVLEAVTERLKGAGFVVSTEIDIKETLKRKLDVDSGPFKILRVYNPQLTARAHSLAPDAVLLPYNVTIAQMEDGSVEVSITDPLSVLTVTANPLLQPVVSEAYTALQTIASGLQ